jgi:signal transduction histidine kinase
MQSFSEISTSLLSSYNALEARAKVVEQELAVANRALEAKVAELDAVLASLPVGVVVRDAAGRVTRVNQSLAATLDTTPEKLLAPAGARLLEAAAQAEGGRLELASGRWVVLDLKRSQVEGGRGELLATVEIVDDRTELEELTERMHAMDKVAALGTMAGGIAHEIRNPLNAVAGFAQLLRERILRSEVIDDPKLIRFSEAIAEGAAEADAIISSLMKITSPERLDRDRIDVAALLEEAVEAALDSNEALLEGCPRRPVVHVHADCPELIGDRIKLRQALRNLISNAIQANPGGDLLVQATPVEGQGLLLSVDDSGPGIPADLRRRILDPFFTTRAEGTGLGLALTNTIADLHGGRLEIQPTPSELGGARVALLLPSSTVS